MLRPDVTREWVGDLIIQGMIGAIEEWDCSSAYIRLREPDKSEDKAEPKSKAMSIDTPRNWSLRLSMSRY
ncbi:hypothetical protein BHM03_00051420 [Ensete ventricosum]|nr:hypothetical protein BHM03_00051420 [Ensete ventricosum]